MAADLVDKAVKVWGWIFRAFTIASLTFIGYHLLVSDVSVADTPLAQLTLRDIFGNLAAAAVGLGGIVWFFCFPSGPMRVPFADGDETAVNDPYYIWGKAGGYLLLLAFLGYAFFYRFPF